MVRHAMRLVLVLSAASLLFACGGDNQEVGTAQTKSTKSLSQPAQCSEVATIAAGAYHTVGLKEDKTVVAVGYNGNGQLNVSSWKNIKAVAAGNYHTVGLKEDGTVVGVGNTGSGRLNVSSWTNIKAIAASNAHTVGLKEDGTVVAVGYGGDGQLNVSTWTNIKAIAAGYAHTVGLKEDGTVVAVGYNGNGRLNVSSWTNIKAIAAGYAHTVGLKEDGTVVAVGNNTDGRLNVSSWKNIKAIAAGYTHTVGLKEDGTVVAVGNNNNGQLNVSSWKNIKAIAANAYHTLGLKEDGTVVAVGYNGNGQLNVSSWMNIMPICEPVSASAANQDASPPITAVAISGTPGNNGWYVSDVQMTLTATDNAGGSGVKEIHYSVDGSEAVAQGNFALHSIVGDGVHTVTYYAIDNALNAEVQHQKMSVMIDKTPPVIQASVSPSPNANGWNNTDVTVTFTCSDSFSGIASCPDPITVTAEGAGQTVIDTAVDKAGNSATASVTLNIDKTPPTNPSLTATPSILWPSNHKMRNVLVDGSAADGGSGIASTMLTVTDEYGTYNMTVPGFGSTIALEAWREGRDKDGRLYTITAVITDKAGNQATGTTTVLVPHDNRKCDHDRKSERHHGHKKHKRKIVHHPDHHRSGHHHR